MAVGDHTCQDSASCKQHRVSGIVVEGESPVYPEGRGIGMIAFNHSGLWLIFRAANAPSSDVDAALRCGTVVATDVRLAFFFNAFGVNMNSRANSRRDMHFPLAPLPFFENPSSVSTGSARLKIQTVL